MKNPEDYLCNEKTSRIDNEDFLCNTTEKKMIGIIKQAQKEAYNQALEDAARVAECGIVFINKELEFKVRAYQEGVDYELPVFTESILKLKK